MQDPYVYPGTTVLVNKLGLTNAAELHEEEGYAASIRQSQIAERGIHGELDYNAYKNIHKTLFSDMYEWAGKPRTVDIWKATVFAPRGSLEEYGEKIFDAIAREDYLQGIGDDQFADRAAYHLGEINFLHPFREGNGRTQRIYIDQLAARTGRRFAWEKTNSKAMIEASMHAATTDHHLLRELLAGTVDHSPSKPTPKDIALTSKTQPTRAKNNDQDLEP